ncbi:MAG: hypothetical protein J2P54_07835, partial [Bradyrhizobiaceae bacterium]|nr:hypothetical protein [Bradyrhizobiaceae bacterium]
MLTKSRNRRYLDADLGELLLMTVAAAPAVPEALFATAGHGLCALATAASSDGRAPARSRKPQKTPQLAVNSTN